MRCTVAIRRLRDPALAHGLCDVEAAVKDDVGDSVESTRRQALCRRNEVARGVVHQAREAAAIEQCLHHVVNGLSDADVDAEGVDSSRRELRAPGQRRLVAHGLAPAADRDVGTEAEELFGHRAAQPRAAAGDEDALALHEIALVHVCLLNLWLR